MENTIILENSAAAKREARRKKILENSNNRLGKITGRVHDDEEELPRNPEPLITSQPNIVYPDPDFEREIYEPDNQNIFEGMSVPNSDIFELLNTFSRPDQNGNISNMSRNNHPQSRQTDSTLVKIIKSKIHILFMSVIIYILVMTNRDKYIGSNIFLVLLTWEIVEVFLLKTYENRNNFIGIIFLLGGISQKYSQIIIKVVETVNKLFKDVAIFAFFFVSTHLFWNYYVLNNNLKTILNVEPYLDVSVDDWK